MPAPFTRRPTAPEAPPPYYNQTYNSIGPPNGPRLGSGLNQFQGLIPTSAASTSPPNERSPILPINAVSYTTPLPESSSPLPGPHHGGKIFEFPTITPKIQIAIILMLAVLLGGIARPVFDEFSLDPYYPSVREQIRHEWELERDRSHREQDAERAAWQAELRSHDIVRARLAEERARLDSERLAYEDQKRRDAQREQEEEANRRAGLHWGHLHPHDRCSGYRRKEYSAKLEGAESGYVGDRKKDCEATPVKIHGVTIDRPYWCEDLGACNGTWGHWIFEEEDTCAPYWDNLQDLGCTGPSSGVHRYQAQLIDFPWESGWHEMCMVTPNTLQGQYQPHPNNCDNHGNHGVWGIWFIPDAMCS
ncbi:hypothetical protein BD779DRAFT_1545314 [Infundibulicybe gibba]|nr:hypothetical protein BD779DRAFT_1545314 [Infundibulicybe gibba]